MRFRISILKKFIAIITIVLATAGQFAVFGQPNFVSAKYITPDQQTLEVRFDENLSWTSAGTWTVRIGGIPVVGVLGPGGNGSNILIFALPSVIDFSDVTAGVTIEYADDGDVAGPSGQLLAFGPQLAVNDVVISCGMLTGVQGISVDALSGVCAPVTVTLTVFWEFSKQARNSVNFNPNRVMARINWNDPANTFGNFPTTESALGSGIFSTTQSFTYPLDGTECVYEPISFPYYLGPPAIICNGGSAVLQQALTNWNTDNRATGQLQINPDLYQVCLGQDFTLILDDATLFNCRKDIEPNKPNIDPRFVQFVYGTMAGRQIPDVYVNGVQVTDNAGNVLFPGGYVDPTVHYYDSGDVPFPNAVTLPVDHAGNLITDLVGDFFEVTIRNWNTCNPYLGGLGTPVETTALIEIVDGPIADAGPDQTICEGETATMSGGFSNAATAATWSTDGDGTFNNINNMGAIYTPGANDISNGSVLLHLTATGPGGCPPFTDDILLTIDPAATPATTGPDDAVCGTSYPDLGGNAPNAGAGETGLWTVVSGNGNFTSSTSPNSGVNNLDPGPNVFRWTITRGLCTSSETITISSDQSPNPANAGPDQDLCDNQSTVLNASPATNGGTGTWTVNLPPVWNEDFSGLADGTTSDAGATAWTSSSSGGTASEVIGGVFHVERATLNNWTSEVIDISSNGMVDLSVDISGTGPMENSDYLRVYYKLNGGGEVIFPINGNNVNNISPPEVARANGLSGTTIQIIIRARTSQNTEVYTFDNIVVQPTLGFADPNDPNTTVSGLVPGQNVLTWTVTSQYGACPTTSDNVIITRDITPDAADAGLDQQFCELTTATMAANSATFNGTGTWSILTPGPALSDLNDPVTGVTNLNYGNNDFRWTIVSEYGICPSSSSDVRIIRDEAPAAASTGPDQDLCGTLVSNPLGANAATVGVGTWSKVSGPGTVTFAAVNSPNTTATVSVEGGYIYRWTIVNGTCSTSEDIAVFYSPAAPATPTIAGLANICEDDNSVNFTCNSVVGGVTYTWTVPAAATITAGQGTTSITVDFTGVPVGADNVTVQASNACGSNPADVYPITIEARAAVNAGSDEETCENTAIDLSTITTLPSASNYASLLWTSSGSGTFNNPNALQPIYTPGVGETGNITLTLTASGNGSCPDVSDNLTLSVTPLPTANSGGNDEVCVDQNTYSISGASHTNGSILWTTSGDGSFSNNTIDNPVYTLGANDKTNGSVNLTMTVSSPGSCADAVSGMILTITPLPTANSGGNDEVCADQVSFTLSGASHTFGSVAWSSPTGGAFNDNSLDNPTYTLTAADRTNGSVVLTMTVTSPGSCAPAVSSMTLTVTPAPIANAGGNDEVCEDQPTFTVTGASHSNGSVSWSTGGDGTFVNANVDNPIYNLGPTDISSGSVVLTMTVSSAGSCTDDTDNMTLTITPLPTANAGGNSEVCVDQAAYSISGASHTNGVILWTTAGDGSFSNSSIDNPSYTLGANDKTTGSVILTMTITSPGSCAPAADNMTLTITPLPTGNTGGNGEVCEDQNTYTISGASHTNGNVTWSSPSGGTFNDNTLDNPVYTLSAADKASGSVILTMTVTSSGSCAPAVETMTLTITPLPTANAGADDEICEDQISYTVSGAAATNGSINWSTSGDGSFLDATALNPVYTMGPNDKTSGSVTLTIMVSSPGSCGPAADNMTLSITPEPTANAGSDDEICASEVSYTVSGASFTNGNVIWTTSGDGSFTDLTATNPVYNIGATDRTTGSVTLTMTVNSPGSCPPDSDDMVLTLTSSPNTPPIAGGGATEMCVNTNGQYYSVPFNAGNSYVWNIPAGPVVVLGGGAGDNYVLLNYPVSGTFVIEVTEYSPAPANCPGPTQQITANVYDPPTANAGSDVTICAGSSAVLGGTPNGVGVSASGGSGNFTYLWAPSFGLDDASAEHPNASPLVTTTYTLFVTDNLSGCASVQDQVIVNVIPVAAVDAGTNEETCENMPFDLSTSGVIPSASNYSSVNWTTSGTGTFNNPNVLTPIYTPGAGEIGAVTLTLSATGNAPCGIVSDIMTLSITPAPVTDAGSDEETCEGTAFDLSLSIVKPNANNFISVSWTHSGTGSFNNPNILTPTYMPGAGETGIVTLTMTVTGNGSCTTANDNMQLVVVDGPDADAGSNAEICEGTPFDLSTLVTPPTAANYVSVNWTHNGTGSFADPNILVPVYNPGVGETGIITLTMTVTGNAPCLTTVDDMALTIYQNPVLDPMLDKTICSDNTSGILLNVAGGSVAAVNYNINDIRITPGLIAGAGNASSGAGQASIAIRDDIFTNETANPLTVEYDVIPVSGDGCLGDLVTITLTVNPEPVLDPNLDNLICSGDISNITLATNGTSVAADVYNINAIRVSAGLSSSVGNASPGAGQAANAILNDGFTNTTAVSLTVEYDIIPVSAAGCFGDMLTVTLTVNPEPVMAPGLNNSVCSDQPSAIILATNGTSVNAAGYNIMDIRVDAGLIAGGGNSSIGNGQNANAISNDVFTNTTAGTLTVEYDVIPVSAANCEGDLVTITLTVSPKPVMAAGLDNTVCSDNVSGIVLATDGTSIAASSYNILDIRVAGGLIPTGGNAAIGNGQPASAIASDQFNNTTGGSLAVQYDVVPVSGTGCLGDMITITLTVDPEPVLDPNLDNSVCSDQPSGITLNTNGISVAANGYNIVAIRKAFSLTAGAGNAIVGNGQAANAIAADLFTNTTTGSLTVEYDIVPVSADGCEGDLVTVVLTVDPKPVLNPNLDASVCSDLPSGITLNTDGLSVAAANYNITDIRVAAGLIAMGTNASIGNGQASNAIVGDIFTNPTAGSLTVEYDVVPVSAGGCLGDMVTVILTIDPEPVLDPNLDNTVCSDQVSGIVLNTDGVSIVAANYNIVAIRVPAGLTSAAGNSTTGNGQASNAIAGDVFTNQTAGSLNVEYDIVPVSGGGCLGDMETVTLTVDPEPVLDPNLDNTVCSDMPSGIVLNTNGTSVAAANYNIVNIRVAAGLVPDAGNAISGNSQASNAIAADVFTNTTSGSLTVEYDIVPVSGGNCLGDMVTVTLTVDAKPVLDPMLDKTICSDNTSGIVLTTNGVSIVAANYNINDIRVDGGLTPAAGNASTGNAQAANAISGDSFTNPTAGGLTVEYDVVPVSADGCLGDLVTITLTVNPEPVLDPNLDNTVCSDEPSGITLNTDGVSIAAASYTILDIRVSAGLGAAGGNAIVGIGQAANAIVGDVFTNPTAGPLTVEYDIVPVEAGGCEGDMLTVILTVDPKPVMAPGLNNSVCSDQPSAIILATNGTSVNAAGYNIIDIRVDAGLIAGGGNSSIGNGQNANAISNDVFTNTTAGTLTVEYDVIPVSAANCEGDLVTITLTVSPKPVMAAGLDNTVCSDNVSGIVLATDGTSIAASSYNILDIRVAGGLIPTGGNAAIGNGQPASAIASDQFNNTTGGSLAVQYDVVPVSGTGCLGDMITITLTVDPEPVLDPNLDNSVCSDQPSGITLNTNGISVAANGYNIVAIRKAFSLTAGAGNAIVGNGQAANAIAADLFTNTTTGSLTVEYDIVPVSADGCEGDLVTVVLTVDPKPVLNPNLDASVCSDLPSGITLNTDGLSVAAANYNITDIRVAAGLVPLGTNASIGNSQASNAIVGDIFTNPTAGSLTVEYDVVPVSAGGCFGDMVTVILTIDPEPVLDPNLDNTVCSDQVSGIVLNTDGVSIVAANYNIVAIRVPAGLTSAAGNSTTGNGQSSNAIAGDVFTNQTAGSLNVEYDIVPVSGGGCLGDMETVTLTVDPEPVLDPNLDNTVCSDMPSGIVLNTNGTSVAAANYNIVNIRVAAGLVPDAGNAISGNSQASNAIAADVFTNTTSGSLTVEYDIVPVSGGNCLGDMVTVTLTVDAKPVLDPMLDKTICSDNTSGIVLTTNGVSIVAANYNINDIRVDGGLTPAAGNASTGNAQAANAISGDSFTNPTAGGLTVEYDVVPVSADGCLGDMVTITLTVNPEPVLDPNLDNTVCSDEPSGITLNTDGVSIAAASYTILDIRVSAGLGAAGGNAIVGIGQAANAIVGDIFTNPTAGPLTVEYDIVPVEAGGCEGDMVTVTLTIDPGPVLDPNLNDIVCSDQPSGIMLNTDGTSVPAANYNILDIRVDLGLVAAGGNASIGNGQANNAIAADVFTNTTAGSLTVEYDIVPISAIGCEGDMVTVVLTINPEPVLDPNLDATICSDLPAGITFNTIATSVAAANYTISDIRADAGLVASGGNASIGIGQPASAIASDIFTNTSGGSLTVEYDVVPISSNGCEGTQVTITLTIDPEPVLDPNLNTTICSDLPSGIILATNGTSIVADNYNITGIRTSFGLQAAGGNASTGNGQAANAIANDIFTNTTSNVLTVEYDIIPVSIDGCEGDLVTVILTVNPEPVLAPNLNTSICSDLPTGITLNTNGISVAASSFNILDIRVDAGLVAGAGNSSPANGLLADAIANDLYTNNTNGLLYVEYDVVPVSASGCEGKMVTVIITIEPEPVLDPNLDNTICSDQSSGITLTTDGISVPAGNYNIVAIRVDAGLSSEIGNASVGNGQPAGAIFNDRFVNITASQLTVEYDIVPVSAGGCEGDLTTVTLTIDPKPVMDPALDNIVCSDQPSSITLNTDGTSVGAATYSIISIRKDFNLIANAGNATTGVGQLADAIVNDMFTNNTTGALTVEYDIRPVSGAGCIGDMVTILLTVDPKPVMDPNLNKETCSNQASGILLKTNGTSEPAASYNIVDIRVDVALIPDAGNASVGNGQADNAIIGDIFTNATSATLNVEYDVVPVSLDGCIGDMTTIILTVNPQPVLDPNLDAATCSDAVSGITLAVDAGSVAAASYNVSLNSKDAALVGTPTTGLNLPSNAIASDMFRNTTGGSLTVVYDVIPVSADGCEGNMVQVTLTVNPEPILASNLNSMTCSDAPGGIIFNVSAGSVAASSYNLVSITVPAGLMPGASNATIGTGMTADTISNDVFTNLTGGPQLVIYEVIPVSADGCEGDMKQVMLTVNPEPILDPGLNSTTCSDVASGINLSVAGGSVAAANYNVLAINVDPGLVANGGNASPANGLSSTAIANDIFTNTTTGALTVTYDVVPVSASGCIGDMVQITLIVNPEPILNPALDATVCSGLPSGIVLDVSAGSVGALTYNLVNITVSPGLVSQVGNATVGTAKPATVITNDVFTNTTANPLTVTYGIIPVSADGCLGDLVQVILTVDPEPVIDPNLNTNICSDVASGIVINVAPTSVAADHFDISAITVDPGLVSNAGNALVGAGQDANAIAGDIFTNFTAGPLAVVYDVTPVSAAGCIGELVQITLIVNPEPILNPVGATVCSRNNSGIVFSVNVGSVAASTYNILAINMNPGLVAMPGNAIVGNGQNANAISTDKFINTTNAALTVVYDVVPVSGVGCEGAMNQITFTIDPEPVLDPNLDTPVCSDQPVGVTLVEVPGSVAAASYTINSVNVPAGLIPGVGNAGPGMGQMADAIANDVFTNQTANPLDVIYTVVPVSAIGCVGLPVQIAITINPEPILSSGLNRAVCSDENTGIVLDVSATSTAAVTYNIINIMVDPSLTPDAMNAVAGNGLASTAIQNDRFTNITSFPLNVVYDIVPVSADGCEGDMRQVIVTVQPKPILTPGLNETLCSNLPSNIILSVTNGVSGVTYNWDAPVMTGGMTGGTAGPSGIINDIFNNTTGSPQTATYRVVPMSGLGCLGDTSTVVITVNPNPTASINGGLDPLFVCGGEDLILNGNPADGSGNYVSHMWSGQIGSLDNITIQTPTFNTTFTGSYNMTYTVTDDNGCMGSDNVTINVDSPRALFSMSSNTGCNSVVVDFTNNSIGATTYTWDFGDGSPTDNTVSPSHTYNNLSTIIQYFNVKLFAESAGGCIDSVMQVVTVYPTVEASFTITPDTICHGDGPVQLAALPGGSAYHWDFGDGNSGYAGNVTTHSFTNTTTGIITRTVTLTTESFYGCTDVATQDIVIYPTPIPEFSPNPASQTWPGNQVTFINQTNAGTWTYFWNFGDGNTSTDEEPTHTYGVPGTYTVTLEVSNDRCSEVVSHNVEINPTLPIASFTEVPPACSPYTVQFENTSLHATSYFWDFGDGTSSSEMNPEHTFYRGGTYVVRLTAIGPGGQDKYQQMVEVYQSPTAMLDVAPNTVYVNDKAVKCFNLSTYGDSYLWEFGDGTTDTIYEPYHIYMEEGIYDITLHVYSDNGCEDVFTLSPAVTVEPAGVLRYPSAFIPNKGGPTGGGVPGDPNLINTVFFPPIQQQVDDYHLEIFNRWGEKLFESTDINIGWDGYYKGQLCKQDVYVWQVKGKFNNGKPYRQAGDITLLH